MGRIGNGIRQATEEGMGRRAVPGNRGETSALNGGGKSEPTGRSSSLVRVTTSRCLALQETSAPVRRLTQAPAEAGIREERFAFIDGVMRAGRGCQVGMRVVV